MTMDPDSPEWNWKLLKVGGANYLYRETDRDDHMLDYIYGRVGEIFNNSDARLASMAPRMFVLLSNLFNALNGTAVEDLKICVADVKSFLDEMKKL